MLLSENNRMKDFEIPSWAVQWLTTITLMLLITALIKYITT